jgi:flagellar basal body-associated protein FliL
MEHKENEESREQHTLKSKPNGGRSTTHGKNTTYILIGIVVVVLLVALAQTVALNSLQQTLVDGVNVAIPTAKAAAPVMVGGC